MKRFIACLTIINFTILMYSSAGPSSLDSSFNPSGTIPGILNILPVSGSSSVQSLAIQTDGKIVYAGFIFNSGTTYGILGRINIDGSPDLTFNQSVTPGYVIVTPNGSSSLQSALMSVKIKTDGKIVVAGYTQQADTNFYTVLARYNTDGTLDTPNFGTGGVGYTMTRPAGYIGAQLYALSILLDGSFIVAGTAISTQSSNIPTSSLPMVASFTSNGLIDNSFATNGYTIPTTSQIAPYALGSYNGLDIQGNGNIVVTGYIGSQFQSPSGTYYTTPVQGQMIVTRYTNGSDNSGIIDPYFNNGNILQPSAAIVGTVSIGFDVAVQTDDQIIIVGMANPSTTAPAYTIMRLNYVGTLDTFFNSDGQIPGINQYIFGDTIQSSSQSVTVQIADQKIVTVGMVDNGNFNVVAIRYEQDGTVDTSFDFTTNQNSNNLQFRAVAIAPNQKIIASGVNAASGIYYIPFFAFLGGSTPELGITSTINTYGYNPSYLSQFFYIDMYAQIITDPIARAAAIDATNSIFSNYTTTYSNQSGFNYVSYAYLMNIDLLAAAAALNSIYFDTTTQDQITQFFNYIIARESQLLIHTY